MGENTARHLNLGAYQVGYVDDYFRTNSNFSRQQSRDSLNSMYLHHSNTDNAEAALVTGMSESDIVFKKIVDEILPEGLSNIQRRDYERNVIAVLAFFFEACDIFKEPPEDYDPKAGENA